MSESSKAIQEDQIPSPGMPSEISFIQKVKSLKAELQRYEDTLRRIATEFKALHADSDQNDSIGEIYYLLRKANILDDDNNIKEE